MNKNLLIIGFVWPEPKSSAAGIRMLQLIKVFQSQEYQITFASSCAKIENAFNLENIGVAQVDIELNNSSFDDFIKELNPSVVLFDRFMMEEQFGWRVYESCPQAIKLLDTEDLHCLRKGRESAFKDGVEFNTSYLFNDTAKREIASIYRCDLSLIISEAEMDILKNQFNVDASLLMYLPFILDKIEDEVILNLPKFKERQHFIAIGNFLHEPNYNAVLYLKQSIWPLIKQQLLEAELHIYGAYATQKVNQLHNEKDGFLIKGFAKDANEVMKHSKVCLAPLRFGAGLKGKLVDAMLNGTPCVTTTIGAEGMFGDLNANSFIVDNPETFASKAVELYSDSIIWEEKQHNGFQIINQRFNKNLNQKNFIDVLEKTKKEFQNYRLHNFIGQMLQHHTLQSTKYMSRWIEEKNRA